MSENNENINPKMNPEQVPDKPGNDALFAQMLLAEVREKDLIIQDLDRQIAWGEDIIAELERKFAETEQTRKEIRAENEELDKQYELIQIILKSAENSSEIGHMSLSALQALLKLLMEAGDKMHDDPLYKEIEKDMAKALMADMERRQLEMNIRTRESILAQEKQIKDKIRAKYCLVQQMKENLERLKAEESEKTEKLLKLQAGEKMENKMDIAPSSSSETENSNKPETENLVEDDSTPDNNCG